jgi:hypothetical protein
MQTAQKQKAIGAAATDEILFTGVPATIFASDEDAEETEEVDEDEEVEEEGDEEEEAEEDEEQAEEAE